MQWETCRFEVAEGIATITLDHPPVNAQNQRLREETTWLLDSASDRNDVRVVILTAAGKVFSAGADIKERRNLVKEPGDYVRHNRLTREFFYAPMDCTKPVIAAVNGPAIGAGFALALHCDILLFSDDTWISMPEITVGLAGGGKLMTEHFGRSWARLLYFTGRKMSAAELYRLGIISACVPRERLMDDAMTIAREIAAKSATAVSWIKRGFTTVESMPYRDAYRYEQTITHDLSKTADTQSAQNNFGQKHQA